LWPQRQSTDRSAEGVREVHAVIGAESKYNGFAITKAQIDELKKALPNCDIYSNPTK
jgi:hypothetical protein